MLIRIKALTPVYDFQEFGRQFASNSVIQIGPKSVDENKPDTSRRCGDPQGGDPGQTQTEKEL